MRKVHLRPESVRFAKVIRDNNQHKYILIFQAGAVGFATETYVVILPLGVTTLIMICNSAES